MLLYSRIGMGSRVRAMPRSRNSRAIGTMLENHHDTEVAGRRWHHLDTGCIWRCRRMCGHARALCPGTMCQHYWEVGIITKISEAIKPKNDLRNSLFNNTCQISFSFFSYILLTASGASAVVATKRLATFALT